MSVHLPAFTATVPAFGASGLVISKQLGANRMDCEPAYAHMPKSKRPGRTWWELRDGGKRERGVATLEAEHLDATLEFERSVDDAREALEDLKEALSHEERSPWWGAPAGAIGVSLLFGLLGALGFAALLGAAWLLVLPLNTLPDPWGMAATVGVLCFEFAVVVTCLEYVSSVINWVADRWGRGA